MVTGEPRRILKAGDRCDTRNCGAAAYHRVLFSKGLLDFCHHHYDEAPDSLLAKAVYEIDESWAI
ncbi:DUF7455 domain-containing protein [Agromyces lapidis]|uniref:DUF7455 domain-containing protein n=1 Tax=Agromyces lapidis TaxID=279574 RepID=UPI003CCD44F4